MSDINVNPNDQNDPRWGIRMIREGKSWMGDRGWGAMGDLRLGDPMEGVFLSAPLPTVLSTSAQCARCMRTRSFKCSRLMSSTSFACLFNSLQYGRCKRSKSSVNGSNPIAAIIRIAQHIYRWMCWKDYWRKNIVREILGKKIVREILGKKIARKILGKKIVREIPGKKIVREILGKKILRVIIPGKNGSIEGSKT